MKKMFALGIVVLAISLGFAACAPKGGTIELKNNTMSSQSFSVYFGSEYCQVNDGQTSLQPSATVKAVTDEDTSYAVYNSSRAYGSAKWTGTISGGETIRLTFE